MYSNQPQQLVCCLQELVSRHICIMRLSLRNYRLKAVPQPLTVLLSCLGRLALLHPQHMQAQGLHAPSKTDWLSHQQAFTPAQWSHLEE